MVEVLCPARVAFTTDGTPWSETYGDIYHAAAGGPGQAAHVFLRGNGLPDRWRHAERFTLLETGFGTGLNFLATWSAWRQTRPRPERLHYIGAEKHPFQVDDLRRIHAAWPKFQDMATELRASWPTLVPGFHRLELDGGRVILTLLLGDAAITLPRLSARVDAYYLDGFAPARNPDLWTPELCRQLARCAAPNATFATWSVAGPVRAALLDAGFTVTKVPGFGNKREMLVGRYEPPSYRPAAPPPEPPKDRHTIVLGAGLAGTACCERLAARGWRVDLIERHPGPAGEASGNHAGIFHPLLARDDNLQARLTRGAFLYGLRRWRHLAASGLAFPWAADGLAQLARDDAHETLQRELPPAMGYPPDYVDYLDAQAMSAAVGHAVPMGGWRVTQGGWANPGGLCGAYLRMAGEHVTPHYGRALAELRRDGATWLALDADGRIIATAEQVIIANGLGARALPWTSPLPIQALRGQVTLIPEGNLPGVNLPLCREGYLTPALAGLHCAGASYDQDEDPAPRAECDLGNLARVGRLLDGLPDILGKGGMTSRVGFRAVPPDRLPLVGTLPDFDTAATSGATQLAHLPRSAGLHSLLGYASRGIIWSSLLAELLASRLEGEPLPLEADLVDALDPGRFLLKQLRKQKGPA
jgi:tRNA 5-methylaminomethyl-2-thiouridine biosynthesis bifunctional protein